MLCTGSRVLASAAMFTGLALALGGGHFVIAAIAALPSATKLSHLALPELLRRYGSGRVAALATWLERGGFLLAAFFGIVRPEGYTIPGFLLGFGLGVLGQALYDGSLAALHSEATPSSVFGRYTALKSRWGSGAGLVLGVLASFALDKTERLGVPAHVARALAIAGGAGLHLLLAFPLRKLRLRAGTLAQGEAQYARSLPTPTTPSGTIPSAPSWVVLPRTPEQWALVRFAVAWGFAVGISTRQGEAMAISHLGVSVGAIMLLNALTVGAGVLGAASWGRLGDRFGGKGLMSIALAGLALDPVWILLAMYVHPAFLVPSYLLYGVFNSGWNITVSMTMVRTRGSSAQRIRAFVVYTTAFGLAAGIAPMLGGALLELLDARVGTRMAYAALFSLAVVLRASAYPWLRRMPAPEAESGRYVSAVVLRAMRRKVGRRTRRTPQDDVAADDSLVPLGAD
jgi:hypothetical protein